MRVSGDNLNLMRKRTTPSAPPSRSSSRELATARAAAYDMMTNLLNFQTCATRRRIRGVSLRPLAFANCRKNANASDDHRPPTALAMTNKRQRLHGAAHSGKVRSLWRLATASATPSRLAAPTMALPSQCSADSNGVDSNLNSSKKWQAICYHLKSPTTSRLRNPQIQITHENVCRYSCPCLTANSRRCTLEGKSSPPNRTPALPQDAR